MSHYQPEPIQATRIVDLPNDLRALPVMKPKDEVNMSFPPRSTEYTPILDAHPNPFGVPKPMGEPDFTQGFSSPGAFTQGSSQSGYHQQPPYQQPPPEHMLSSRDIPRDTLSYMQDPRIQPNYIPKPKLTRDFAADYDETEERWLQKKQQKHRKLKVNDLFTEIQVPLFLAFLFFLFQLPAMSTFLFTYCGTLPICEAGSTTLNGLGMALKGVLFALVYYLCMKFVDTFLE